MRPDQEYHAKQYKMLEDIIRSIDYTGYYDEQREKIKTTNKGNALERKLEEISNNKSIEKLKEQSHEMSLIKSDFNKLKENYNTIELIEIFKDLIERDGIEFKVSSYMKETKIYNKNNYTELGKKETSNLRKENQELAEELYNLMEKYKNYNICNNDKYHLIPGYRGEEFVSIRLLKDTSFKELRLYGINDITTNMSNAIRDELDSPYSREYNKEIINKAVAAINDVKNPGRSLGIDDDFQDYVNNIDFAKELGIDDRRLQKLQDVLITFIEIARETWYLDRIVEAFKDCHQVANSECYKEVKNIIEKQNDFLNDKRGELRRIYDDSQIGFKVGVIRKLDAQVKDLEFYQEQYLVRSQNLDFYTDEQRQESKDKINEIKRKMEQTIANNDFVSRKRYAQILDKPEPKMFNSNDPDVVRRVNFNMEKKSESIKEGNNYVGEPMRLPTLEEIPRDYSYGMGESDTREARLRNEIDAINTFDKANSSNGLRSSAYSKYCMAKLKPDFNMSFSEYLERYCNPMSYKEIIENEKRREDLAKELYEDYMNRETWETFEEFSAKKGLITIDVPIEFQKKQKIDDDEYETGRSR